MNRSKDKSILYIGIVITVMVAAYETVWIFTDMSPFDMNSYNSYALQAQSWLQGRLDVDYRSWLEQAAYNGKYYISFPPLPSVILLPFVLIFGEGTPDHFICLFAALGGGLFAYKTALSLSAKQGQAVFWALFVTVASNYLFISMNGWVWYMAQNFSFLFTMAAIYYAVRPGKKKGGLSLFLLACAVGCRPLQLVFFPVVFYLLYSGCSQTSFVHTLRKYWHWLIAPACVALFLCTLNYARFGSIFEFGHNYLPEFLNSTSGQFSLSYIPYNLVRSVRLYQYAGSGIVFPSFDGFAFYIAMPIYLACAIRVSRSKERNAFTVLSILCITINLLALCAHKTMGGWHFGCRYFVDATPFAYLLALVATRGEKPSKTDIFLFIFGLAVNMAGTIAFYKEWI